MCLAALLVALFLVVALLFGQFRSLLAQSLVAVELVEQHFVLFVCNLRVGVGLYVLEAFLLQELYSGLQSHIAFLCCLI